MSNWTDKQEARLERASMAAINGEKEFCPVRARDVQDVLKALHDFRHEVGRLSALLEARRSVP